MELFLISCPFTVQGNGSVFNQNFVRGAILDERDEPDVLDTRLLQKLFGYSCYF